MESLFLVELMCMECLFLGTMSGPCWDHVRPNFTSKPDRALKFSGLSQHGLKSHVYKVSTFWTMSGPFLDYVWTMFSLTLLTDQLRL